MSVESPAVPAAADSAPVPAPAAGDTGPPPGRVVLQSMVLPGWGQFSNHKWLKAAVCAGAYGGLVGWGISLNQDVQDAVGRLHAAPEAEQPTLQGEVDSLKDSRNAKFWFAGLTMLLSMVDAYVDAHLYHFDRRIDATVGFLPGPDPSTFGVRITAGFGTRERRTR